MSEEGEIGYVKEALKKHFEGKTAIIEKQIKYRVEEAAEEASMLAKAVPLKIDLAIMKDYIDKWKEKAEKEHKSALPNLKKIPEEARIEILQRRLWNQNWARLLMLSGGPYYFADTPIDDFQAAWHFATPSGQADATYKPSNWKAKEMYLDVSAWEGGFPGLVVPGQNAAQIEAGFIYEIPGSWIKNPASIEVYPSYDVHGFFDVRAFANNFYPNCKSYIGLLAEVVLVTNYLGKYKYNVETYNAWFLEERSVSNTTLFDRIDKSTGYNTPKTTMPVSAGQTVYAFAGIRPICSAEGYGSLAALHLYSGHSQYGFDEYVGFNGIAVKVL